MRDLSKRLRGTDFRHAVQAIAVLCGMERQEAKDLVPVIDPPDEQRAFQLLVARLVVEGGVANVAARWNELGSPEWRERLATELGQTLHLWPDEGVVEALLAALDDPDPRVEKRAVATFRDCLQKRSDRERKKIAKTQSGKVALDTLDRIESWVTPPRRARIATLVTSALERAGDNPRALLWPDYYIELLGLAGTRGDARALAALERLRPLAGEPRRTEFEKLDRDDLPWPTSVMADKKGVPPGTPMMRVKSIATGLLDLKVLEGAIAAIEGR